jgi:lysophospholipase L1-like esterase
LPGIHRHEDIRMIRPFLSLLLAGHLCAAAAADGWEPAIRAFEARAASIPAGGIVFYGSSTFTKWTSLAEDFPGLPVVNCGFGGSGTADALRYAPRVVVPLKPRWVVLYCGGNDIGGKEPEVIAAATAELIAAIHAGCPRARIALMSLKPTVKRLEQAGQVQEVNRRYGLLAKADPLVTYLDLWTPFLAADGTPDPRYLAGDQLHPSREGYRRIAGLLRPVIAP